MTQFPPPGLSGSYQGACVVCMHGTDTALAFQGEAEWVIAGLIVLGVPESDASLMFTQMMGLEPGIVPSGEVTQAVQCCKECADRSSASLDVGLTATGFPLYRQRDD